MVSPPPLLPFTLQVEAQERFTEPFKRLRYNLYDFSALQVSLRFTQMLQSRSATYCLLKPAPETISGSAYCLLFLP